MSLTPRSVLQQFNNVISPHQEAISINEVLGFFNWKSSTWGKTHYALRKVEDRIKQLNESGCNDIKPLGFNYHIREKSLDRQSFLVLYCFVMLKRAFSRKKALSKIIQFMESVRQCQEEGQAQRKK